MPRLREVDVWPTAGCVDRPWLDDAHEDAFAKASRPVSELVNERLATLDLEHRVSAVRIFVSIGPGRASADPKALVVSVLSARADGFEVVNVVVPRRFLRLSDRERCAAVLDVLLAGLEELAGVRGWDSGVVASLGAHVRERDLRYRWQGRWTQNPSRSLRARCVAELMPDGIGRLRVEVEDLKGGAALRTWGPYLTGSTPQGFERASRTLRWSSSTVLTLDPQARFVDGRPTAERIDVTAASASVAEPASEPEGRQWVSSPLPLVVSSR